MRLRFESRELVACPAGWARELAAAWRLQAAGPTNRRIATADLDWSSAVREAVECRATRRLAAATIAFVLALTRTDFRACVAPRDAMRRRVALEWARPPRIGATEEAYRGCCRRPVSRGTAPPMDTPHSLGISCCGPRSRGWVRHVATACSSFQVCAHDRLIRLVWLRGGRRRRGLTAQRRLGSRAGIVSPSPAAFDRAPAHHPREAGGLHCSKRRSMGPWMLG